MARARVVLLFLACGALLCCATGRRAPEPIPVPPARIELSGYSFLPLAEGGWAIGGRTEDRIAIGKYGTHLDESFVVQAMRLCRKGVSTQESLVDYAGKRGGEIDPKDKRYRNARQDVSTMSVGGALCAVYEGEAEDHGALTRSGRRDPIVLRVREMVCVHPTQRDTLVHVGYSHRHYAEDRDPAFREKSQALFESVEFNSR